MKNYLLLTKKQLSDLVPPLFKGKKQRGLASNIASGVLVVLLVASIVAAFVIIFGRFSSSYVAIKINRVSNVVARSFEMLTACYLALLIALTLTSTISLNRALFESGDLGILITMPFSARELFLAKLTVVYVKQLLISFALAIVVNFTFFAYTHTLTVYGALMTFVVALLLPMLPMALASVLVLPFYFAKRLVCSNYVVYFVVTTAIVALFAVGYSYVFNVADTLLNTGKITSFFNERVMTFIISFTKNAYPANLFANFLTKREIGASLGILLAMSFISAAFGLLIAKALFLKLLQTKLSNPILHARFKNLRFKKHSPVFGLLFKEFLSVLRTPGYSYMYFTTAVVMPIMAFYSAKLSLNLINNLVGGLGANFEICTFIVLLYSTLTNTFCSTNITRDGTSALTMKTLPFTLKQVLGSKIAFCSAVSLVSVLTACVTFAATGLENPLDAFVTLIAGGIVTVAQIVFATRLDVNHPRFVRADDGETKESNVTVSIVILTGLAVAALMGFALLFGNVKDIANGIPVVSKTRGVSYAIGTVLPVALLFASLTFFFAKLKKAYEDLGQGEDV